MAWTPRLDGPLGLLHKAALILLPSEHSFCHGDETPKGASQLLRSEQRTRNERAPSALWTCVPYVLLSRALLLQAGSCGNHYA